MNLDPWPASNDDTSPIKSIFCNKRRNGHTRQNRPYKTVKGQVRQCKAIQFHKRPYKTKIGPTRPQIILNSRLSVQFEAIFIANIFCFLCSIWNKVCSRRFFVSFWTNFVCEHFCSIWNILCSWFPFNKKKNIKGSFRAFEHSSRSKIIFNVFTTFFDIFHRHLEPALAFQLELNRLKNYDLHPVPVSNHKMHLYFATAKKLNQDDNQQPSDYRFFIRSIIRHSDFVTTEASFEFVRNEGERCVFKKLNLRILRFL